MRPLAPLGPVVALAIAVATPALPAAESTARGAQILADGIETAIPDLVRIPAGPFITGSDRKEREAAYRLDEAAYGHTRTRDWKWYENEAPRHSTSLGAFEMTRTPITNAHYAAFVAATGRAAPVVEAGIWRGYKLAHPYQRTRRHAWVERLPPADRGDHPVVLVSHQDARAYAAWLSGTTGRGWRLPSEQEWEKGARGLDGRRFPWGDDWVPTRLNSHDRGPFDTLPVGSFPDGASPFGLLDAAGQVFEWTATPAQASGAGPKRYIVKGGSWDDSGCGVCRPAARHARPANLKHILIGFRLVAD